MDSRNLKKFLEVGLKIIGGLITGVHDLRSLVQPPDIYPRKQTMERER